MNETVLGTNNNRTPLGLLGKIDRVVLTTAGVFILLAIFEPPQVMQSAKFTLDAILFIFPFFALSVLAAAWTKATGLDQQIAGVFSARPLSAIAMAAVFGAFSPFCSCGVVPIIAGLLAAGVPLAPVMAFWIASPLMDPEMFILMAAVFGLPFTVFKTVAALAMGAVAGYATHSLVAQGAFDNPLKIASAGGCCGKKKSETEAVAWSFWQEQERRAVFGQESARTGWFLGKWLTLAFVLESLMVAYIPAEMVGTYLGSDQWWSIPASVIVGVPAYLNGYAAIPTVNGLMDLGMSSGAAMAFMIAGGVTSIPAAMAVWALVKRGTFLWYVTLGLSGSLIAGYGAAVLLT